MPPRPPLAPAARPVRCFRANAQACGLAYDCTAAHLGFDPRYHPLDFRCFFVAELGWGEFAQAGSAGLASGTASVRVLHGSIALASLGLASSATAATATVDGRRVGATLGTGGVVRFDPQLSLAAGSTLVVTLAGGAVALDVPGEAPAKGTAGLAPPQLAAADDGLRRRRGGASDDDASAAAATKGPAPPGAGPVSRQAALLGGVALFLLGAYCGLVLGSHQY